MGERVPTAVVAAVLATVAVAMATVPVAPTAAALPVAAKEVARYEVALSVGGFELPALASGSAARPATTAWTYSDLSGVTRWGTSVSGTAPAFPEGTQTGYIRNSSAIVQQVWLEPGDQLQLMATQAATARTGLQTLTVSVDGVSVGTPITPGDGSWTTHVVDLGVTTPRRVVLAVRGLPHVTGEYRTALLDRVVLLRRTASLPDAGLPARTQAPMLSPKPSPLSAGVLGVLSGPWDVEPNIDSPVLALAAAGGTMYVGGKFAHVQQGAGGPLEDQSHLAAFRQDTGAWIPTFRPTFDGTVWDLAVVGSMVVVAGQFTTVNGERRAGLVALDATTGATIRAWRADLALGPHSTARPVARALDVVGTSITVGGRFLKVTGPGGTGAAVSNIARISSATGAPDASFGPQIAGDVYDIDATPDRIYAVGRFPTVNGAASRALAVLSPTGTSVPGLGPLLFSSTIVSEQYQLTVLANGADVWIGGSQHHNQVYRAADMVRVKSVITAPQGDVQTFAAIGDVMYVGSHANLSTYAYSDATTADGTFAGWTARDPVRWITAYDRRTRAVLPAWTPQVGSLTGEGAWAMQADAFGCLWAGGDFSRGAYTTVGAQYAQGIARFCPVDTVAPTTPGGLTAVLGGGGVQLRWEASTDDKPGARTYEVFRNNRMVADGVSLIKWFDPNGRSGDRYVVRSVDASANRSASTRVLVAPPDVTPPRTPQGLDGWKSNSGGIVSVRLVWTAPTDDVKVTGYIVYRNGTEVGRTTSPSARLVSMPAGTGYYQVAAFDAAGNVSRKTPTVAVTI